MRPTLLQLETALRNADAAGAVEDARALAAAYKQRKAELEAFNPTEKPRDPGEGATFKVGPFDTGIGLPRQAAEFLAGSGRRAMDIGTLGNRGTKDEAADKRLDDSGWATAGGVATDLATMIGGGAVLKGAASAPQLARAAPRVSSALETAGTALAAPKSIKQAAAAGGAYSAATTDGGVVDRGLAAAGGGLAGAAGQAIPRGVARVLAPKGTPQTNALREAGVELTPGQAMGGRWNTAEQKLMSVPILGDAIGAARRRSIEDFNRAAVDDALAPLGVKVPKNVAAGRELVNFAADQLDDAYGAVVPRLTVSKDAGLLQEMHDASREAMLGNKLKQFVDIVDSKLLSRFDNAGDLDGQALKQAESELKRTAREYLRSQNPDDRALGRALMQARDGLMKSAGRYSPPDAVADLAKVDGAYARFLRVEGAAGMQGAKEGVFSPAQLVNQVRNQSGGVRRREFARGNALMQDFATAGDEVLSTRFPDSGTVGRLLLGGGGIYGLSTDPTSTLGAAGGLGLAALPFTRTGSRAVNALMRPTTNNTLLDVSSGARLAAPYLSVPLVAGAMNAN